MLKLVFILHETCPQTVDISNIGIRGLKSHAKGKKLQDKAKLKAQTSSLSFAVSTFETVKLYIIQEDDKMIVT